MRDKEATPGNRAEEDGSDDTRNVERDAGRQRGISRGWRNGGQGMKRKSESVTTKREKQRRDIQDIKLCNEC